jgi:uncharacterized protein (DUF2237 family)
MWRKKKAKIEKEQVEYLNNIDTVKIQPTKIQTGFYANLYLDKGPEQLEIHSYCGISTLLYHPKK